MVFASTISKEQVPNRPTADSAGLSLAELFAVLRRRWKIVLLVVLLVLGATLALTLRQHHLYEASSDVLLSRTNLANALLGTSDPTNSQTDDAIVQTQRNLARSPVIMQRTLQAAGVNRRSASSFAEASEVVTKPDALFLTFRVQDRNPRLASTLATQYAKNYIQYRRQLDTQVISQTEAEVAATRARLAGRGADRALLTSLLERQQQLSTLKALQTANANIVRFGGAAYQVQPRPLRNVAFALIFGLILGFLAAVLIDRLDTRVRDESEIELELGVPLLGRAPVPSGSSAPPTGVATLSDPTGHVAESYAALAATLNFARAANGQEMFAVTSALAGEGKTTLASNVAVSLARRGQRVVLVEFDLRRPALAERLGLERVPGLAQIVVNQASVDDALHEVDLAPSQAPAGLERGSLHVLPAGAVVPAPSEFLGSQMISDLLATLRERSDLVVIDGPPALPVSDVANFAPIVGALVVMTRLEVIRRPQLRELRRLLNAFPAEVLGVVTSWTGSRAGYGYGYGYGYSSAPASWPPAGTDGAERNGAGDAASSQVAK